MRRRWVVLGAALFVLGACGSSNKAAAPPTTVATPSSTASATTTSVRPAPPSSSSVPAITTTTNSPSVTNSCKRPSAPAAPISHAQSGSSYLAGIAARSDDCFDYVTFAFTASSPGTAGSVVSYTSPPFVQQASGAPIVIPGRVFISVKLQPAYTYDFESGAATYTGSRNIAVRGAHCVRAIVETGDSEGVVTWVIGLDAPRGFTVTTLATPHPQLEVTIG